MHVKTCDPSDVCKIEESQPTIAGDDTKTVTEQGSGKQFVNQQPPTDTSEVFVLTLKNSKGRQRSP